MGNLNCRARNFRSSTTPELRNLHRTNFARDFLAPDNDITTLYHISLSPPIYNSVRCFVSLNINYRLYKRLPNLRTVSLISVPGT